MVKVKPRPKQKRKRSRNRRGKGSSRTGDSDGGGRSDSGRSKGGQQQRSRGGGRGGDRKPKQSAKGDQSGRDQGNRGQNTQDSGRDQGGRNGRKQRSNRPESRGDRQERQANEGDGVDINEQAEVIESFLTGLLDSFGLDGTVETRVDDDVIYADINGEQTEALIGPKATILQAIHELAKTVVQRKTMSGARLRLDIGGYAERRREALTIYAGRLAEQVIDENAEIVLEPMNPADRKTVHDAVSDIDGVRSFSEGEDPRRSVVLAPDN